LAEKPPFFKGSVAPNIKKTLSHAGEDPSFNGIKKNPPFKKGALSLGGGGNFFL